MPDDRKTLWMKTVGRGCLLCACAWNLWTWTAAQTTPHERSEAQVLGVWPPPPAEARILYVQSISSTADLGARPSTWQRISNAITGGNAGAANLITPFGVAVDEADNLCVTDTSTATVWFFNRKRNECHRWEQAGNRRFISPVAVAKWRERIFVADSGLGRVIVLNSAGKMEFEILESLERPSGLVVSGERLFVADASAHRIAVFDLQGKLLLHIGKRGVNPGEFNFPTHLAADAHGQLFVTDSMNSRIQILTTEGRFQSIISGLGDGSGHLSRPKGIAVGSHGHVFIADALFDNFQIFDQRGRFLLDVGAAGSNPGEFWLPAGVAISRTGRIYVADSYNRRVQVFQFVDRP